MTFDFDISEITTYEELVTEIKKYNLKVDLGKIERAFKFADLYHKEQKRLSGQPYILHPLTVAVYVVRLQLDDISIIATLLHDTIEDTKANLEDIEKEFGIEVAFIVDSLTNIKIYTKEINELEENVTDLKKLIMKASEDLRVLVIKLCDILHNTITISSLSKSRQLRFANRVKLIYAPLAQYIGLQHIRKILQDKSFEILNPNDYRKSKKIVKEYITRNSHRLIKLIDDIKRKSVENHIHIKEVTSRKKGIYSFYIKLKRKNQGIVDYNKIDLVRDILAARIIVPNIEECYLLLGFLQSNYNYIEEEFDDYIVKPKSSGYMSLHTCIKYEEAVIEIQIRTPQMHEYDEFGLASHTSYKEVSSKMLTKEEIAKKVAKLDFSWLKDLMNSWQKNTIDKDKRKFKVKLFSNSVFVFTPKGKVIRLDKGSTPIDFAFKIHTQIGVEYNGAKINGKMANMKDKLQTADICEIILDKKRKYSSSDWLKYAKMNSTKALIRKFLQKL